MSLQTPTLLGPGEGEHWNFLGNRNVVKVGAKQTGGLLTAIEFSAGPGFGPPPHIHHREDEMFYVVEGSATFWCDGAEATYGKGGLCWLPKGLAHRFEMGPDGGTILQLTTPAQFEDMIADYGHRIEPDAPVEPEAPDVPRLVATCERFGIDLLLPEG